MIYLTIVKVHLQTCLIFSKQNYIKICENGRTTWHTDRIDKIGDTYVYCVLSKTKKKKVRITSPS